MWDSAGAVEFNDTVCSHNAAEAKGGCILRTGGAFSTPVPRWKRTWPVQGLVYVSANSTMWFIQCRARYMTSSTNDVHVFFLLGG